MLLLKDNIVICVHQGSPKKQNQQPVYAHVNREREREMYFKAHVIVEVQVPDL